jgi:Transposase DDE domain
MAHSFASSAVQIKRQFCRLLPSDVILDACLKASHVFRKRTFDPVVTIHLFVLQILHGNTAILHLRHLASSAVNAAAYCQARMRVPLAVYEALLDYSASLVCAGGKSGTLKSGTLKSGTLKDMLKPVLATIRRVLLVDGTSSLTPDTPSIRKLFKQPANLKPGCGYPMAKVLALFDAVSGAILRPIICSLFVHEASNVWQLHPLLQAGDLLVGDRAFCSYVHLAMLSACNVLGLFRVQQKQRVDFRRGRRHGGKGRTKSRFIRKLGSLDQLVEWFKPKQKPKWMSKKQFDALPSGLIVRELRYRLAARGQRTRVVTIVTTLLDEKLYPAERIAELYGLRWQVETHFKELKTGMKMSQLKCKTAEGVKKELLMYFITYNLIRRVILDAAERQHVEVRRISFIDASRWLAHAREGDELIMLVVLPLRPNRHEPRVKKYLKYRYRSMTRPRHIMKKRPYLYADKVK